MFFIRVVISIVNMKFRINGSKVYKDLRYFKTVKNQRKQFLLSTFESVKPLIRLLNHRKLYVKIRKLFSRLCPNLFVCPLCPTLCLFVFWVHLSFIIALSFDFLVLSVCLLWFLCQSPCLSLSRSICLSCCLFAFMSICPWIATKAVLRSKVCSKD